VRYAPVVEANANNHCFGIPTIFESVSSIPNGGVVSTYWTIEAATFVMQGAQASYQFQDNGFYNYTFTAESNFGCTSSITDSVEVFAIPVIALPEGTYEYCENQLVGISASATTDDQSSISSFTWAIDGEVVSQTNPAQFELDDIGAYVLEVVATSNHGCIGSFALEQPIVVYPIPTAGFTWSMDQMNESPTVLVSSTSSADVVQTAYSWGDGSGDEMESHQYASSGSFEITQVVTNSFGCNAYHSEPVEVYNGIQFYIPSAFTPDLNNHNELFLPVLSGSNVTYYVFRVFNRWGNEVFTSTTPGEGWDGYFKGEPVQDGAYNWSVDMIVRGRQDLFSKKGSVLLMR
jgi:gliding motility-associated-like protein